MSFPKLIIEFEGLKNSAYKKKLVGVTGNLQGEKLQKTEGSHMAERVYEQGLKRWREF